MEDQYTLFPAPEYTEKSISSEGYLGKPRLNCAVRHQVETFLKSVDDLLPKEHLARDVWEYVEGLDLSVVLRQIKSVEGSTGRPATDPKILLTLWLFATVKGIGSARLLEQYCKEHDAYKWICGGVNVNYHTLSNFRSFQGKLLSDLLTQSVAILAKNGIISLERASQDGMRVRACAGSSSFNRKETLQFNLQLAQMLVADLEAEAKKNPQGSKKRAEAAQLRAAKEKAANIKNAQAQLIEVRKSKIRAGKKEQRHVQEADLAKCRASTTDPDARVMKMADNGFRPAYNVQFATTNIGKAIIAVSVSKSGSDQKQTLDMLRQVEARYGVVPKEWLQDAGYHNMAELEKVGRAYKGCKIYMPVKKRKNEEEASHTREPTDSEISGEWRERMGTEEGKEIYAERGASAEFVNAQARNRGLQQFLVQGLCKVTSVAVTYAIVQNMMVFLNS